ncbi:F-box only protein 5 [Rhinoraja longicauda]
MKTVVVLRLGSSAGGLRWLMKPPWDQQSLQQDGPEVFLKGESRKSLAGLEEQVLDPLDMRSKRRVPRLPFPQQSPPPDPTGTVHTHSVRKTWSCSGDSSGHKHSPSGDSGYTSLLNISTLSTEGERSLGDHGAESSPEDPSDRAERHQKWASGIEKEEEEKEVATSQHVAPGTPEPDGKPTVPSRSSRRPCKWHMLPALQVGRAVCQSVGLAKALHCPDQSPLRQVLQTQTFPIDRLIGRKMGLEHVDIWKELSERGFPYILRQILRYLPAADLLCCAKVCKMWKKIICGDKRANQALKKASRTQRVVAAKRENVATRGALTSIQCQSRDSAQPALSWLRPAAQPRSANASQKSIRHQQVVKTLKQDEVLKVCPLCASPAKFLPCEERAVCTSEVCAFDYCSLCLNFFHGSKLCARHRLHSNSRAHPLVGSKKSKQNLRRL